MIRTDLPVERQVESALQKLIKFSDRFGIAVWSTYRHQSEHRVAMPEGVIVAPPDDAGNDFSKEGCNLIGLARTAVALENSSTYYPTETVYYDAKRLATFPNTDQAALWVHEAVYSVLRAGSKDEDSRRSRKVVAYLFSDLKLQPIVGGPPFSVRNWKCSSAKGAEADVSTDGSSKTNVHFISFGNFYPTAPADLEIEGRLARSLVDEISGDSDGGKIYSADGAYTDVTIKILEKGIVQLSFIHRSINERENSTQLLNCSLIEVLDPKIDPGPG